MKILLIPASYLPVTGGLQTVTSALARSLNSRGHDVRVITNKYPTQLDGNESIEGISITRWHFLYPRFEQLLGLRPDLFIAAMVLFPLTLMRLIFRLRRERSDVVNLHFAGAAGLFVLLARKFVHFRLVVSLHGDDVEGLSRRKAFDRWLFRKLMQAAEVVTACSGYLLDQAMKIEPAVATKGRVVFNGMDEQPHSHVSEPEAGIVGVVAVGRLVPKKGFDVLLQAFAAGSKETSRLTLIGDGPERERLKELARSLGLNGEVNFCGAQDREATLAAMKQANVIAIPSLQEPFGLVALEAMALGKPIVASRVGGLPEVLAGADAVLVEPGDAAALAKAIAEAFACTKSNPNFGLRNRECAAGFSTQRMVDQYLETYSEETYSE